MSENNEQPKAPRTIPEIQQEYAGLCQKAGQLQYQLFVISKDLALLNDALRDLNFEAAKVQQAETAAKKAEGELNA